jgi:hypothetical protein
MCACSEDGCEKPVHALCVCHTHYMRLRRAGLTAIGTKARGTLEERFWRFVEKTDSCWLWTGKSVDRAGYGKLSTGGKGSPHKMAHRISYELHKGEIPDGLVVMHSCDNPKCVNPEHLSVGTHKQNTHDAVAKGRMVCNLPVGGMHGRANPNAKLNDNAVRQIRASTVKASDLAAKYGVSKTVINMVRRRETWRHI